MGIGITHEQRELASAVRGWIARAVPPEERRALLDEPESYRGGRPGYWDGLAEQGLLGVHLPEECGGGGGDLLDLAVVLEEAALAALPGPYAASSLAAALLHRAGAHDLAAGLADGTRIGAVALGPGTLTAVSVPDGYVLDGAAPPVLSGGLDELAEVDVLDGAFPQVVAEDRLAGLGV
ncbi:acyl-CoA dehydrogenase family protein, partial [Streptomyces formicae]